MKAILGFTRMSVRGLNKVKRELGFVLMALNIRKVVAQRAENNQKFIKRQFLYYFNRNCLFHYQELYVPDPLVLLLIIGVHVVCYDLCYARFCHPSYVEQYVGSCEPNLSNLRERHH